MSTNTQYVVGASLQDIQAEANWLDNEIKKTQSDVERELNKKYGGKGGTDWMVCSTSVAGRQNDRTFYDGWMAFRGRWDQKKKQIDAYYFGTDARLAEEKAFEAEWKDWHVKWEQRLPSLQPVPPPIVYAPPPVPGTPGAQPGTPGTPGTQPGTPPAGNNKGDGLDYSTVFLGVVGLAAVGGIAYFLYKKRQKPSASVMPMTMQPMYAPIRGVR